jgi:adenylate cyclase
MPRLFLHAATSNVPFVTPDHQRISFRIGVNLGDLKVEPEDIFRDDVNIASRLEALAEPGGICISRAVRDRIGERLPYSFENIGERRVKSIAHPVHAYRIRLEGEAKARPTRTLDAVAHPSLCLPYKASIAVLPFQNMSGAPEEPIPNGAILWRDNDGIRVGCRGV